jgi:hypothetical protein
LTIPFRVDDYAAPLTFVVSSRLGTVTGTVDGAGAVYLVPEPIGAQIDSFQRMAVPDDDGVFTFKDMPPGKYRPVIVSQQDHMVSGDLDFLRKSADAARTIEIKAGEVTHITLHL